MAQGESVVSREHPDLDIEADLTFQKKEWRARRILFALLCAFVVAAALGATGMGGPLSDATAGREDDPIFVEFQRVVRRGAIATMRLHLHSAPGVVKFWVSAPYFEHVRIQSVAPQPQVVAVEQNRHVYTMQSGSPDITITLDVEHQTVGKLDAAVGLVDGPFVQFSQLALF